MWGLKRGTKMDSRYDEESADETPYKSIAADSQSDDTDDSGTADEISETLKEGSKRKKKKVGRKSFWSPTELVDLTDVICSDEEYRKKLIFWNHK